MLFYDFHFAKDSGGGGGGHFWLLFIFVCTNVHSMRERIGFYSVENSTQKALLSYD